MSPGRIAAGRGRAVRVLVALAAVSSCLGAVAFAATRPEGPARGLGESKPIGAPSRNESGSPPGKGTETPPRARFVEYPEQDSIAADAQFRFHVPPRAKSTGGETLPGSPGRPAPTRRFQCRFDDGRWADCSSPQRLTGLGPGAHSFTVRALDRAGRPGPAISHSWRQIPPPSAEVRVDPVAVPFSIELRTGLEELYPGFPPQQVRVVVSNPNPGAIEVTGLTVAIGAESASCPAENFVLTQSSVSPATPLVVPAGASVELPTATASAPTLGMLNLPVNQDPCRGAEVPLVFSGEARG